MKVKSQRIEPFQLEREFAQYEFSTRYMASSSDAQTLKVEELLKISDKDFSIITSIGLGYSDSLGILPLRQAIAAKYFKLNAAQILTHVGAEEAIFNFFHACLSSGDHVVVHAPCYQSFVSVPKSLGIEVSLWSEKFESNWDLSIADLERLLQPNTKAVFINFPHNPTGSQLSLEKFHQLIEVLREKKIFLFSDEVYRGLEIELSQQLPPAVDLYENSLSLGVLSKAHGLAGLRVGWIATSCKDVYEAMAGQKDYTTICSPIVCETLGVLAVQFEEKIIARNRTILRENYKLAEQFLIRHADKFEWIPCKGSTMMFPRAKTGFDLEQYAARLLRDFGIFVVRGHNFQMEKSYFRLGMGRSDFAEVLKLMEAALKSEK